MQDVAVLATGRQVRAGGDDGSGTRHFTAITVEVSPEQAQRLIVAQRTGKLTAMLRHPDDRQPLGSRVLDLNALLGIVPPAATAASAAPGPEIIVGGRGALVATRASSPGVVAAVPMPEPAGHAAAEAGWSLRHPGAVHAAPQAGGSTAAGSTAAGANAPTGHEGIVR
jgi:pilus assembly protein CpaB